MYLTTHTVACQRCEGSGEIESWQRERDTGAVLTYRCPDCDGEGVVCRDCCQALGDCTCDDGRYAAGDDKFTGEFEAS